MNPKIKFELLRQEIKECRRCPMVDISLMFPGVYHENPKYFFIGASPWTVGGPEEAFRIGAATANFEKFLKAADIDRADCFTTNAVAHVPKDRDMKSRGPNALEMINCSHFLKEQIDIIQPKLIVALGSQALTSMKSIQHHSFSVNNYIGQLCSWYDRYLMILTHPSPMAVSFHPESQQIEDYILLKYYAERIHEEY